MITNDDRYTPPHIVEMVREVFGGNITLDPATSATAQRVVKAQYHYTKKQNGLQRAWLGNVFLNPPYGHGPGLTDSNKPQLVKLFLRRLIEQYEAGWVGQAIVIVQAKLFNSVCTQWFKPMLSGAVCYPHERIKFWNAHGNHGSPATGTVVFYLGDHPQRFAEVFQRLGTVHVAHDGCSLA